MQKTPYKIIIIINKNTLKSTRRTEPYKQNTRKTKPQNTNIKIHIQILQTTQQQKNTTQ